MGLKKRPVTLNGNNGEIKIVRDDSGVPVISACTLRDCSYGLGWVHGGERQLQLMLTRILLRGEASEKIADIDELVEVDRYMKRMNFFPDVDEQIERLYPEIREILQAYCDGMNKYLRNNSTVWELKLLGYKPEFWDIRDCLLLGKVFGFIGLVDAQGNMEKLIVQMIQKGIGEMKLRELFPYLDEEIDIESLKKVKLAPPLVPEARKWLDGLRFTASNNWAVSGELSESGNAVLCGDPHLEVNRVPAIWMEAVMRYPDNYLMGATLPGVPGILLGRTKHIAWSPTYTFMDMLDYRIEECREGKFRRGKEMIPFSVREEEIRTKKGRVIKVDCYENEHGLLEGDPHEEGHYLVQAWSAAKDCGADDVNSLFSVMMSRSVREAMKHLRLIEANTFNFAIADTKGNIGLQMTGRMFDRPKGVTGMVARPGWLKKYNSRGYVSQSRLPSQYNPREGFIVTANQDVNYLGQADPINLPMATYRAERISRMLQQRFRLSNSFMKDIQYDLYSVQAEKLMKYIKPHIPDNENGKILSNWNLRYDQESKGAMLFESVYRALLKLVFGEGGMGKDVVNYLMKETGIFNDYYGNFDRILLSEKSQWFGNWNKDEIFRKAVNEGLKVKAKPYGKTRRLYFSHLLFGGKLPHFLKFDYGPLSLPGNRATVTQGQIFKNGGRVTTFSPSYRFVTDMGEDTIHSNMPGGSSDRRFSRWYMNDIDNWILGEYKVLQGLDE